MEDMETELVNNSRMSLTLWQQVSASSAGALITSFLMTPLDVVKVRLQQQIHPLTKGSCFLYSNGIMDRLCTACADVSSNEPCEWFLRPGNFTGTKDAFVKIAKYEGVHSLWNGLSPTLIMALPITVLYFSIYENVMDYLRRNYQNSVWCPLIAGSSARFVSTTIFSPLELIRTKMQSERHSFNEIGDVITATLRSKGWRSFWQGWAPTMMRDMPFSAIYWCLYEYSKKKILQSRCINETNFFISSVCGGLSGAIAATLTLPFDVIKTRRQVTLGKTQSDRCLDGCTRNKYESTFQTMQKIVRQNGYPALYAGLIPRLIKVAPACAIMISSYEYAKLLYARRNRSLL